MIEVKIFLRYLLSCTLFGLVLAGLHYLLLEFTELSLPSDLFYQTHGFVYMLAVFSMVILILIGRKDFNRIGFAFAGLVLVKMIVSFAFLFPFLKSPDIEVKSFVFNFFGVYLLYIFFEAREAYTLIQKGSFTSRS